MKTQNLPHCGNSSKDKRIETHNIHRHDLSISQLFGKSTYIKLANQLVVIFLVAIASSVPGFAAFDELFGIIKLFFCSSVGLTS